MSTDRDKEIAARAALALLPDSGIIGLGTGSTVKAFIEGVAELVRAGRRYQAVVTSEESRALAERLGIPVLPDEGPWDVLLCVDGADEVSATLDLIKGGGGAHTREKIVNYAARKNAIVVDGTKLSEKLGQRRPVPVEVLPFAHRETCRHLAAHGTPTLRERGGVPVRTDSGNYIYDVSTAPLERPMEYDRALRQIPGVVETGLFCGRADIVLVAESGSVRRLERPPASP
ncbi:MAG TPA: ribose-5-phosphate isomerase RpiA [Polyangiaceae bacterium]|nr:ribose-5-phosphate isomerase RpiA [Polyangiaceae bacterium]